MQLFTGEGVVEMASSKITASSDDGDVTVRMVRRIGCAFPAEVNWSAKDGDALFGEHYDLSSGWC